MTPGSTWSKDEIIITVFFSSRRVCPQAVRCLLLRRGYDRSVGAIERQLTKIKHQHSLLRSSEGFWDLDAVDMWVDEIFGDHELVNQLVRLSSGDAEDMLAVCLFLVAGHECGLILGSQ